MNFLVFSSPWSIFPSIYEWVESRVIWSASRWLKRASKNYFRDIESENLWNLQRLHRSLPSCLLPCHWKSLFALPLMSRIHFLSPLSCSVKDFERVALCLMECLRVKAKLFSWNFHSLLRVYWALKCVSFRGI